MIGDEIASKIVFVCSDMWKPYLTVIREKCSEALHILDHCCPAKLFQSGVNIFESGGCSG
jgi:transposase